MSHTRPSQDMGLVWLLAVIAPVLGVIFDAD